MAQNVANVQVESTHRLLAGIWRVAKLVLILSGLILWIGLLGWLLNQRTSIIVTGTVVDAETGMLVPDAKVVVSTWYYDASDSNPRNFGALTDAHGQFRINANPGYWIAWCDISASTPQGKYAQYVDVGITRIEIIADPMNYRERTHETLHYGTFRPWGRDVHWQR